MSPNQIHLIDCLIDVGLSEREAKVFLALLNKRNATAGELQRLSGIPQSKVYEIIDSLVRQGYFLERKIGRKRTFEMIDPKVTLSAAFKKLQTRLRNSYKQKQRLESLFEHSEQTTEPFEYIEILRGNEVIHQRYCQLVHDTTEELLGFGRGPYACDTSEKSAEQDRAEMGVLERGGVMRWVYELKLPEDSWILTDLENTREKGAEIRVAETLPIKMMIFDRRRLLVAEEDPSLNSSDLVMSIVKQRTIVNAFRALFEFFWGNSIELDEWRKRSESTGIEWI